MGIINVILLLIGVVGAVKFFDVSVKENDPEGTVLTSLADEGYTDCNVTSATTVDHNAYFNMSDYDVLLIKKSLDLEFINDRVFVLQQGDISSIQVNITCRQDARVMVTVNVEAVNEFAPYFIKAPFYKTIPENEAAGLSVFRFQAHVNVDDLDRVQYGTIQAFNLHPFQITQFDGRSSFNLNSSSGEVTSKVQFDYDLLQRKYFILNISATDDGGLSTTTTLNVSITDVDDMPPVFVSSAGCHDSRCHVTKYSAAIDRDFHGALPLEPGPLIAEDGDRGINAAIQYSIHEGNTDDMTNNIEIDTNTGQLTVVTSYRNVTNVSDVDIFSLKLTIIATEQTSVRHNSNVTFTLTVYRNLPTSPTPTSTTSRSTTNATGTITNSTTSNDDNDVILLVIKIVVPCVVCIIIICVVAIFLVRRRRQKAREAMYNVKARDRTRTGTLPDENRVSTLSSTPINAYELMSVYARMPLTSNGGSQYTTSLDVSTPSSRPAESSTETHSTYEVLNTSFSSINATAGPVVVVGDESPSLCEPAGNAAFYAVVDKRKQRKRAVAAMDMKNLENESEATDNENEESKTENEAADESRAEEREESHDTSDLNEENTDGGEFVPEQDRYGFYNDVEDNDKCLY